MRNEEYTSLQSAFERYDGAAAGAEEARKRLQALFAGLRADDQEADDTLKILHAHLLETVRSADLAAQLARGVLGVVAAVRGLNEPQAGPNVPYSPPEGEDYVGT